MLKRMRYLLLLSLLMTPFLLAEKLPENSFRILCYHNVVDKITDPKIMNITTDQLIAHFKWLKTHHYHVISVDDILAAKRGEKKLPPNAVLLTFDDGYVSFYTRIYPLLKLYNYHAVFALVGKWQQTPLGKTFLYGTQKRSRKMLLTWEEIREMMDSGLVEFASHTYDSHHGILANPQGNTQPAMTTLQYDPKTGHYETVDHYIRRISEDLQKSSDVIYRHTGKRPRIIVWPYGAYTGLAQQAAKKSGMPIAMTLDDGINTPADLPALKRVLIESNPAFDDFYWSVTDTAVDLPSPEHTLFIDIAEVYDPDPKIANKRLGILIEKIRKFKISTVILSAGSDLDKDGYIDTLYFPNETLPMRSDFLNRVAWQLKSRAPIEDVYVSLPLYTFEKNGKPIDVEMQSGQQALFNIYYSLSRQTFFKGILFDDSFDPKHLATQSIIKLSQALYQNIRPFSGNVKTALMIDARALFAPDGSGYAELLKHYHYLYLDTRDLLRHPNSLSTSIDRLSKKLAAIPGASKKSVVVLDEQRDIADRRVIRTIDRLYRSKIVNVGYRPSTFVDSMKSHANLIKIFSLRESPFE